MSVIDFIERYANSDQLTIARAGDELTIVVDKPPSGRRRQAVRLATGLVAICLAFYLLAPIRGLSEWTPVILAGISFIWLVVIDLVMERYRKAYRQEILISPDNVRIASMASRGCPIPLDVEIGKVVVTTTIPMIRGEIRLCDRNSSRVLKICEEVPFHQRYFAAQRIAEELGVEFTSDRNLSASESDEVESLRLD